MRIDVQNKLDSLSKLQLPTTKITQKMDSIEQAWQAKVDYYKNKLEKVKSDATSKLKVLILPPELQTPINELQTSIQEYSLPGLDVSFGENLKSFSIPDAGKLQVQSLSKKLELGREWNEYTGKLKEVSQVADKAVTMQTMQVK